jgi:hypothetical protein
MKLKTWVIMDKKRKVIGMGVPRNRYLDWVETENASPRILTYSTEGRARSGYTASGFFKSDEIAKYLFDTYDWGVWWDENRQIHRGKNEDDNSVFEPVMVEISIEEVPNEA